ncbi:orexigenic neuropeptide QRFP preproprotein [Daubentonia madagascariensis]|uniref:Orexigenic neuropeptide QRFP preproprotein n=1 Tax=Daubentonia madagascariensis TaxID=31869 RepID=A0ABD2ESR0_DAUMA
MMSPYSLAYLLLLPLGTCFPLSDRRGATDALGSIGAGVSWANLAEKPQPPFMWGSSRWSRAPRPQALLVKAKELQTLGRAHAGFRFRFGRQDEGSEAAGFLPTDGEKARGPLGNLAEGLNGCSRKKGGFSFRFGRR